MSSIALLRCRNGRPIKGLVTFVIAIKFSLKILSSSWNWKSTVAIGASNCPLAIINWKSTGGSSFDTVCGASNRILRKSAPGVAIDTAPVSMSPSMFNSPKPIGKYSILCFFCKGEFVDSNRNVVSLSGVAGAEVKFGRQ